MEPCRESHQADPQELGWVEPRPLIVLPAVTCPLDPGGNDAQPLGTLGELSTGSKLSLNTYVCPRNPNRQSPGSLALSSSSSRRDQ